MTRHHQRLPQLDGDLFLTDGGLETTLIFNDGLDLPDFAAFHLLQTPEGEAALDRYFRGYAELAKRFGTGLILESATWRANADWGRRLGYEAKSLAEANVKAIRLLEAIRAEYETMQEPVVISGCIGPRGDGYVADRAMDPDAAAVYHSEQVGTFVRAGADMVCAITMNYVEEALGVAMAAKAAGIPAAISFTVETDGNLPTGQYLRAAIDQVDEITSGYPAYYMINCAHPTHFERVLTEGSWLERIRGVRANASRRSHAELNEAPDIDSGDPYKLGQEYAELMDRLPCLNVMGGCCGTDERHVEQIAELCAPKFRAH
jgi:S-methylmethionine-dependent homocysteine/selenocysteine methylase